MLLKGLWAWLEWPWLVFLNLWNHLWNFGLWLTEIRRFYRDPALRRADRLWMVEYGLSDPFALSRKATQQADLDTDLTVYGETPWTTLERVCRALELTAEETFVELGAGTGRNLLFVCYRFQARAVGYELIPRFVEKFTWLRQRLQLTQRVEMHAQNWFDAELDGQVLFLVGSCYSDAHLERANQKLAGLAPGTRVASVSYPLDTVCFEGLGSFRAPFSWGMGTVYLQIRRPMIA